MNKSLEVTREHVRALARLARGKTDQASAVEGQGISLSAYRTFEAGDTWPRNPGLRAIEQIHGWKAGIIDEVELMDIEPSMLTLEHMQGKRPLLETPKGLQQYSTTELQTEIARRVAEAERAAGRMRVAMAEMQQRFGLAASVDLGDPSIGKDTLPDE